MADDDARNVEAAIALSNQIHYRAARIYALLIHRRHPYADAFYEDVARPLQNGDRAVVAYDGLGKFINFVYDEDAELREYIPDLAITLRVPLFALVAAEEFGIGE